MGPRMPVTIELTPDIEAGLSARARERGLSLDAFIAGLLRTAAASETGTFASPASRAAAWREAAKNLPRTPPLPDDAIDRDSIYAERG